MKNPYLILLMVLVYVVTNAQSPPIRFQHIDINDGLSLSSVYSVFRDSKGYMWFGTEDGLNRYDGYHFEVFRTDIENSNSICHKWIESIVEDERGHFWFGSSQGLSHYNPVKEVFANFSNEDPYRHLSSDTITCLYHYEKIVYVGTARGLNQVDTKTLQAQNEASIASRINEIIATKEGEIYVASNNGLFKRNNKNADWVNEIENTKIVSLCEMDINLFASSNFDLFFRNPLTGKWISHNIFGLDGGIQIESIEVADDQLLWISTNTGLYSYNYTSRHLLKKVDAFQQSNSLAINSSKALVKLSNGDIWYGTHGDGVSIIHSGGKITNLVHSTLDNSSLSQNHINCIYEDTISGNVWIGTYGAGLNIYNRSTNKFELYQHNPLSENSLSSNFIWSIWEASDGTIWIGTNDKGVCCIDTGDDSYQFYDTDDNNSNSLSNSSVRDVFEDSNGIIWMGTDGGGLNRFDPNTKKFTAYVHDPNLANSISDNSVRVVFEDSKGQLWIGTRNGLNLFDHNTNTFRRFMHDDENPQSISHNFVYSSIVEDKEGYIWIGTYGGGVNRLNPNTYTFKHYTTQTNPALSNDIVFSILEDEDNNFWLGTNSGLNYLNLQEDSIQYYGVDDGLPNEVIYSILTDEDGALWLSTNKGICCFDPNTKDTRNFDVNDGLQSNEFNGGAYHKGNSGTLYFGGVYGLNIIRSKQLIKSETETKAIFTHLDVMGNKVATDVNEEASNKLNVVEDEYFLARHISYLNEIILPYSNRFFSLEFSGMNHLFPSKTQYAFQLDPLDKEWHMAGNRNFVSYANVDPGKYIFKVKCTNEDGSWSENPSELNIQVLPPFWMKFWFILLVLLIFTMVVVFVYRYLLRRKTNHLLRKQNLEISKANEQLMFSEQNLMAMNATKDKFFSIISHDLKNPFASLMSISDVFTDNYDAYDKEDRKECVTKMHGSIKQIYALLENLLTWSRSQRGKIDFKAKAFDLNMLIQENINLYRLSADKKAIQLKYISNQWQAYGDRNSINTVLRNLLGNAMKFTKDGGTIEVNVSSEDHLHFIKVMDDGIGISAENQKKLFRIDQKLKKEGTHGEKGTGLGLIICKEFVEKNGGEIGVESQEGQGATFWFTLPQTN